MKESCAEVPGTDMNALDTFQNYRVLLDGREEPPEVSGKY